MRRALLPLIAGWLMVIPARSQFYAPETDFHDPGQRRFPVEAARVLAWNRNLDGAGIADVNFRLEKTPERESVWSIEWRDATGSVLRKATVKYREEALLTGPAWYRGVWMQLTGKDWSAPVSSAGDFAGAFWRGVESAGISRIEGLAAAFQHLSTTPRPAATDAAMLAGTLTQTALPMLGHLVTLDSVILARAAAWLCAAEQWSGADRLVEWAPILALSGRAAASREAWLGSDKTLKETSAATRFWDVFIRMPLAPESLPFIARPENRLYAAPLFSAYSDIDPDYGDLFTVIGPKLFPKHVWERLYDYAPSLNHHTHNRWPVAGDLPSHGFREWIALLRGLAPVPGDAQGTQEVAREAKDFEGSAKAALSPAVVRLLNDGVDQGAGPLVPVAIATVRDVLGFGWEFGGIQIGAMHTHISILSGQSQTAGKMEEKWFQTIQGWAPFTQNLDLPPFKPLEDAVRYDSIMQGNVALWLNENPPKSWTGREDSASIYLRRRWLMDPHRAVDFLLTHNGARPLAADLIRRCIREGGQRDLGVLATIEKSRSHEALWDEVVDEFDLREDLARAVPASISGAHTLIEKKFADGSDPFGHAQALERLNWKHGIAVVPEMVFLNYVRANALDSARRFYDRWYDSVLDRSEFEDKLGAASFSLALIENDEARLKQSLAHCAPTFGHLPEIATALLLDDLVEARKQIDAAIKQVPRGISVQRYEALRDYLPLIPALNDPERGDHARAVDPFPTAPWFLLVQCVLLNKAHLSVAEAERFLTAGGDDAHHRIVIAALRKDREEFERLYKDLNKERFTNAWGVLNASLRNRMLAIPPPKEQPDLMPPDAKPLLPRLRAIAAEPVK